MQNVGGRWREIIEGAFLKIKLIMMNWLLRFCEMNILSGRRIGENDFSRMASIESGIHKRVV